ncbi:MAG TPA: hypothetical protein VN812_04980 [Candidatus Acidoferrales bacterium]|nr:hypothetical protein [Candidatus Acidoferrales bacterium]
MMSSRGRSRSSATFGPLLVIATLVLLAPRQGFSFENEPRGFGKALFGMSVDEVKAVFPKMQPFGKSTPESAALLVVYTLDNQTVLGLKRCKVVMRFDPNRLYEIEFNCGSGVNVPAALQKHFGGPTQTDARDAFWQSERTQVSLNTKSRQFAFFDQKLNFGFQQHLAQYVRTHQPGAANAPTPAATPE